MNFDETSDILEKARFEEDTRFFALVSDLILLYRLFSSWFLVVLTKGNSPFGAWVVCVYRLEAVESPDWVNAAIHVLFYFLKI